ncbi:hypothetical protein FE844_026470 (plasmid) [Rhizobium indicum]|uniref:hypothetical protein n=1 Tax=Rhizobium indicum TaxID=2583231 RepID=UPI0015704652|nr:hypothetical protein [Rhizobium indicum]QKK32692.1 hypothetical protein FE844_026470 [Rhizobium indicum]
MSGEVALAEAGANDVLLGDARLRLSVSRRVNAKTRLFYVLPSSQHRQNASTCRSLLTMFRGGAPQPVDSGSCGILDQVNTDHLDALRCGVDRLTPLVVTQILSPTWIESTSCGPMRNSTLQWLTAMKLCHWILAVEQYGTVKVMQAVPTSIFCKVRRPAATAPPRVDPEVRIQLAKEVPTSRRVVPHSMILLRKAAAINAVSL